VKKNTSLLKFMVSSLTSEGRKGFHGHEEGIRPLPFAGEVHERGRKSLCPLVRIFAQSKRKGGGEAVGRSPQLKLSEGKKKVYLEEQGKKGKETGSCKKGTSEGDPVGFECGKRAVSLLQLKREKRERGGQSKRGS